MKKDNKKVQYALLGLVLLIWGTVAYKMINWNAVGDGYAPTTLPTIPIADIEKVQRDSFVLQANYRDPFLSGKIKRVNKAPRTTTSSSKKYNRKAPPPIAGLKKKGEKPPQFKYLGFSLNDNEITRVRISIDGLAYTFKLNEKKQKIRVKEMYRDSVIIRYKGQAQTLYRK